MPTTATEHTAGLGPYELQDPVWVKMSGAVASGVTKKRKKSDTKPQAQKNKCYNEKRRREQENLYIEDLADLISASFAEMSSLSAVKPDKCAILQETVNQIQRIKEQELSRNNNLHLSNDQSASSSSASPSGVGGSGNLTAVVTSSTTPAVQQGEVSSSRPTDILANSDFAPFLLEALEGFLIIVSKEGRIEQCSKNIEKYIKFTQEEVLHKDFFNIIHLGDTARFNAILKPSMSVGWNAEDTNELSASPNQSFTCRFLVKPPDDREASLDERQQRVDKYEQMHVCSTEVQYPPKDENAETCLMCIARRIPHTEKAKVVSGGGGGAGTNSASALEQFSTKLDINGKIVSIDTTTVSTTYAPYINKSLIGSKIQELCPASEVPRINTHLAQVIQTGQSITATFRLCFANAINKYINIQSKSKFFKSDLTEHIMSTHFIIGIGELDELESGPNDNSSSQSVTNAISATSTPNQIGGDPVMASVMNGATPTVVSGGISTSSNNNNNNNNNITVGGSTNSSAASSAYNLFPNAEHEFDFTFPASSWEVDLSSWGETPTSSSRPSSRHSATATTPVSTPRPPSAQGGVQVCVPSPLHQSFANQPQPSPATSHHSSSNITSGYNTTSFNASLDDESIFKIDSIKMEDTQNSSTSGTNTPTNNSNSNNNSGSGNNTSGNVPSSNNSHLEGKVNDSGHLRRILSKKPNDYNSSPMVNNNNNNEETSGRNSHCILQTLLKHNDDDDDIKHDIKINSSGLAEAIGMTSVSNQQNNQDQPKVNTGNNTMLLKILNEKSDDDDSDARIVKQKTALLHQLLKNPVEDQKPSTQHSSATTSDSMSQDDLLLRNLGFTNSPSSPSRKRSNEDSDDHQNKRLSDGTQVSSSGNGSSSSSNTSGGSSKLWEKNKMLAQLLAAVPSSSAPIPPLPPRVLTATPQEISRVGEIKNCKNYYFNNDNTYKTATSSSVNSTMTTANQNTARGRGSGINRAANANNNSTLYLNQILSSNNNPNFNNDITNQRVPTSIRNSALDHQQQQQHQQQTYSVMRNTSTISGNVQVNTGVVGGYLGPIDGMWENDKMLSDILDQVIDSVPAEAFVTSNTALKSLIDELEASAAIQQNNREITSEAMAINAVAQSLRQCENVVKSPSSPVMSLPPGTPPAYSTSMTSAGGFPPPPVYPQQRPPRFPRGPQYAMAGSSNVSSLSQYQSIAQQKRRLLIQQQQQQLLIPSNATAELNQGITNIDTLLNNTVAPNVSLQRSSSVSDAQLSPGYANMSPNQRLQQPYSPSYSQANQFQTVNSGARLSPLPTRPANVQFVSNTGGNTQQSPPQQAQQQTQQQWGSPAPPGVGTTRMGLSQQQNPMLNAQLTGTNYQNRPFTNVQRSASANQMNQRTSSVNMVGSPGSAVNVTATATAARQSPFADQSVAYQQASIGGGTSPTAASPTYNTYQQQQLQHRLQRTVSAPPPSATTHLPGGLGSPRHHYPQQHPSHNLNTPQTHQQAPTPHMTASAPSYHHHHPHHHPHNTHPPPPPTQGHQGYDSVQYCYDQSSLQLAYNGPDRGRAPPQPPPTQGGGASTMASKSDFVRQELRAIVGARTGQQGTNTVSGGNSSGGVITPTSISGGGNGSNNNNGGGNNGNNSNSNSGNTTQQQRVVTSQSNTLQQLPGGQQVSTSELEALGITFEMPSGGCDSPKIWGTVGNNDIGSMSPQASATMSSSSRTIMDEVTRPGDQNSSLLQKLLSE